MGDPIEIDDRPRRGRGWTVAREVIRVLAGATVRMLVEHVLGS